MLAPPDWHMSLLMCLSSMLSSGEAVHCVEYTEFYEHCTHFRAASHLMGQISSFSLSCLQFTVGMSKYLRLRIFRVFNELTYV